MLGAGIASGLGSRRPALSRAAVADVCRTLRPLVDVASARMTHHRTARPLAKGRQRALPPSFRDDASGHLRTVYKEIVVRFVPGLSATRRAKLLRARRLMVEAGTLPG